MKFSFTATTPNQLVYTTQPHSVNYNPTPKRGSVPVHQYGDRVARGLKDEAKRVPAQARIWRAAMAAHLFISSAQAE